MLDDLSAHYDRDQLAAVYRAVSDLDVQARASDEDHPGPPG
jgi:hypothetical protein